MIRGGLFTRFFLEDGITVTRAYREQNPAEVIAFADAVRGPWAKLARFQKPSEAETEADFIYPVLELLHWQRLTQQEPGKGRRDIADELLFLSEDAKARASGLHLTFTANDMTAFARNQGYGGPPFAWDDEDRLRRRARRDAVFFHLYGLHRFIR